MNKRLRKKRIIKFKKWLKDNNIFFFEAKELRKIGYNLFNLDEDTNFKKYYGLMEYKNSILNSLPINQKILLTNKLDEWIKLGISRKEYKAFKKKRFISTLDKEYIYGLQFLNSKGTFAWCLNENIIAVI